MFRSIITLFVALAAIFIILPSTTDATPLPFRMAKRNNGSTLAARDFNCNIENVQCCQQLLSKNEATKSLGGLLNLPVSALGNVGLSCTVSSLVIFKRSIRPTLTSSPCVYRPLEQPLLISALSQCKSTPVCCSQVTQSGAGTSPSPSPTSSHLDD